MSQCPKCGSEIPGGELICPVCNYEIQLVPDYETLSSSLLDKNNTAGNDEDHTEAAKKQAELIAEEERIFRRNRRRKMIVILAVAAALIAAILFVLHIIRSDTADEILPTYEDYYTQASAAYESGQYANAAGLLAEALKLQPDSIECLVLQAKLTYANGNQFDAIVQLRDAIIKDPEYIEAYRMLLKIYQADNDTENIRLLLEDAPEDIKKSLSAYIAGAPIFSVEAGTYTDELDVVITSDGSSIYYSIDGSSPTKESNPYSGPVHISAGTTVLKAVSVSSAGILSTVTSAEYVIDINLPPAPTVSPASGTYYGSNNLITITVPEGCTCYYAFDSKPDRTSEQFKDLVAMPEGAHIFYAVSFDSNGRSGPVSASTFVYNPYEPATPAPVQQYYYDDSYYYEEDNSGYSDWTPTTAPEPVITEVPAPEPVIPDPTAVPTPEPTTEPVPDVTQEPDPVPDVPEPEPTGGTEPEGDMVEAAVTSE